MLFRTRTNRISWCLLLGMAALLVSGCGSDQAEFKANWVFIRNQEKAANMEFTKEQVRNIQTILVASFGTPDSPNLLPVPDVDYAGFIDLDKLKMSAGPVGTDKDGRTIGLYRRHCVHCHGVTGDGLGPTAGFLNPYPRDYRMGLYKFKSTPGTKAPTHDDLMRILDEGVPGTAMPSFKVLAKDELSALIHYVKYLSLRGQVERELIIEIANELDEGELMVDTATREKNPDLYNSRMDRVKEIIAGVVEKWKSTEPVEVPDRPAGLLGTETALQTLRDAKSAVSRGEKLEPFMETVTESIEETRDAIDERLMAAKGVKVKAAINLQLQAANALLDELAEGNDDLQELVDATEKIHDSERMNAVTLGRELFFSTAAGCAGCHGKTALGDGRGDLYDDWTNQINVKSPEAVREAMSMGALKPRLLKPRNLRYGVFRGGRRPVDIFWRIHNGIAGTPMPAAKVAKDGAPTEQNGQIIALTTDQIWYLVEYVRWLPFESISQQEKFEPVNKRTRQ